MTPAEKHATIKDACDTLLAAAADCSTAAEVRVVINCLRDLSAEAELAALKAARPHMICAYCKKEMRPGPEPTSHGCCPPCKEKELAKLANIPAVNREFLRGLDAIIDRGMMPGPDDKMGPEE